MLFNVRPTNLDENVFDITLKTRGEKMKNIKRYRRNEQTAADELQRTNNQLNQV